MSVHREYPSLPIKYRIISESGAGQAVVFVNDHSISLTSINSCATIAVDNDLLDDLIEVLTEITERLAVTK